MIVNVSYVNRFDPQHPFPPTHRPLIEFLLIFILSIIPGAEGNKLIFENGHWESSRPLGLARSHPFTHSLAHTHHSHSSHSSHSLTHLFRLACKLFVLWCSVVCACGVGGWAHFAVFQSSFSFLFVFSSLWLFFVCAFVCVRGLRPLASCVVLCCAFFCRGFPAFLSLCLGGSSLVALVRALHPLPCGDETVTKSTCAVAEESPSGEGFNPLTVFDVS